MKWLTSIFLFIGSVAFSQIKEVAEFTMLLPENLAEDIEVLNLNYGKTLLVNYQEDIYNRRKKQLILTHFDAELNVLWNEFIPVERLWEPVGFKVYNQNLYCLFKILDKKRLELVEVNLATGSWFVHSFEMISLLNDIDFEILNSSIFISGDYNLKPVIEVHSTIDKSTRVLPDLYEKNHKLVGMGINSTREEIYVVTQNLKNCGLICLKYDSEGKLMSREDLGDKKHRIKEFEIKYSGKGEPYIMGFYGSGCNTMVNGFFTGSLDKLNEISYTLLSDMESYNNLLSPKRRERRSIRKALGKSSLISHRAIFSVPLYGERGFLASAEIYNQQRGYNSAGRARMSTRGNPDLLYPNEYKIYRLLIAEFNYEGDLTRDYMVKSESLIFNSIRPQTIYGYKDPGFIAMMPGKKNTLKITNMETGDSESIPLFQRPDFQIVDSEIQLVNLSSKEFMAYGVAEIRYDRNNVSNIKELYFIKKFEIEE